MFSHKKHAAPEPDGYGIGCGQCPFDRFTAQLDQIRPAPADLKACFRRVARRKVAKDRTITFNGRMYEAPVSLIGQRVELLYHENDDAAIELRAAGKSYGYARELDLHVNCRVKRDENNKDNVILTSRQNTYYNVTFKVSYL